MTFDVVGRKRVQTPFRILLLLKRLPVQPQKTNLPRSPGIDTKRMGQRTAVDGTDAKNIPTLRGGCVCDNNYSGLGNRSIFYPHSSVGNIECYNDYLG